jgi:hypothetical protein
VLLAGSTVTGATMAFRQCFTDLVLPIPDDLPIIHDAWIAVLVSAVAEVAPVSRTLIRYRQHEGQQIGATPKVAANAGVTEAMRRRTEYDELIAVGIRVHRRLDDCRDRFESEVASARLAARLRHMQARVAMPDRLLPRVTRVATELGSGRYHAFSNGLRSAAKDLFLSG